MNPLHDVARTNPNLLISHVPHAAAIGMTVERAERGNAWLRVAWSEKLIGNPETRVVHGGVITTLLDNCAGIAVMMALREMEAIATIDLRIDYMKPATPDRDILAHAACHRVTRSVAFVRGVAYHDDPEDPIATAVATFMVGAHRSGPAVAVGSRSEGETP